MASLKDKEYSNGFKPLGTRPNDTGYESRHKKLAAAAARGSYKASVELHCLACVAWNRPEARDCKIKHCPLWQVNRKIFKGKDDE